MPDVLPPVAGGPRPVYVLTGPTAVGKTEVALRVAERLNAEIISADSMAIYRKMDAATAKPTLEERRRVPHHMVDVADPGERFTVADYRAAALAAVDDIFGRGRRVMIVGGTRLYILALMRGFAEGPDDDLAVRDRLLHEADTLGLDALHARLAVVDPESSLRISPGDRKRIVRALEVFERTGKSISQWQHESQAQTPACAGPWVALLRERAELYDRINRRVNEMIRDGLVEEVKGLLVQGYDPALPALQGHGYKEIIGAILGRYSMAEGIELMKKNTRNHAKRQLSWLRGEGGATPVPAEDSPDVVAGKLFDLWSG